MRYWFNIIFLKTPCFSQFLSWFTRGNGWCAFLFGGLELCESTRIYTYVCMYIYIYVCIYAQVYIIVGCRSETAGPNSRLPSYWNALPKHKQSAHLPKKDPSDNEFADHLLPKLSIRGGGDHEFCPHFKSLVRWVCKATNCRCFFFQCSLWDTKGAVPLVV